MRFGLFLCFNTPFSAISRSQMLWRLSAVALHIWAAPELPPGEKPVLGAWRAEETFSR